MKANISRRWPVIICNKTRPSQAQSYSKRSANKIVTWRPWLVPFWSAYEDFVGGNPQGNLFTGFRVTTLYLLSKSTIILTLFLYQFEIQDKTVKSASIICF